MISETNINLQINENLRVKYKTTNDGTNLGRIYSEFPFT